VGVDDAVGEVLVGVQDSREDHPVGGGTILERDGDRVAGFDVAETEEHAEVTGPDRRVDVSEDHRRTGLARRRPPVIPPRKRPDRTGKRCVIHRPVGVEPPGRAELRGHADSRYSDRHRRRPRRGAQKGRGSHSGGSCRRRTGRGWRRHPGWTGDPVGSEGQSGSGGCGSDGHPGAHPPRSAPRSPRLGEPWPACGPSGRCGPTWSPRRCRHGDASTLRRSRLFR